MSEEMTTDSPYYKWAGELVELVRSSYSFTTMRLAMQLRHDLNEGAIVKEWFCDDCDYKRRAEA